MTANQARDVRIEETAKAGKYRKRRMDIAEKWLEKGTITSNQHTAAVNFAITFENAQMREHFTLSGWDRERVDGTRGNVEGSSLNVLKARKRISHTDLIGELLTQLKFVARPVDCKKRIESLIEREYLERDEEDSAFYKYIA